MRQSLLVVVMFGLCVASTLSNGQAASAVANGVQPIPADSNFFRSLLATPQFARASHMSADAVAGIVQGRIRSVPQFSSSLTFQGTVFPYTMVGDRPQKSGTTEVDTSFAPISFAFEGLVGPNGGPLVIEAMSIVSNILNSPLFASAPFSTGHTQFGDAVQRAEFFSVMRHDWHTLLKGPRMLTPVTITVPPTLGLAAALPDGTVIAVIDTSFMSSQLSTILQLEGVRVRELPIFVTHNVIFADFMSSLPVNCCVGGFHGASEAGTAGSTHLVQTFAFATSLDSEFASLLFGPNQPFVDVNALSHEISEWMNDPFVSNIVPPWQTLSTLSPATCNNLLQTGDPVDPLGPNSLPVMVNGFTYHPQTEAWLQWFSGESPSSAIGGTYSFPDTTLLTSPSTGCQ